jgi:hypothetical protein
MSQSFWQSLYRSWIWLGVPVMMIALAALGTLIAGVVVLMKKSTLSKVPLAERQEVQFAEAGRVVLSTEGPLLSNRAAHVDFELSGIDGEKVEGQRVLFRARSSGISKARMERLTYDIPRPGRYVLRMTGLGAPQVGDVNHAVVFARPHLEQSMMYVLGIVLSSGLFIVSLVFFLLRVIGKEGSDS